MGDQVVFAIKKFCNKHPSTYMLQFLFLKNKIPQIKMQGLSICVFSKLYSRGQIALKIWKYLSTMYEALCFWYFHQHRILLLILIFAKIMDKKKMSISLFGFSQLLVRQASFHTLIQVVNWCPLLDFFWVFYFSFKNQFVDASFCIWDISPLHWSVLSVDNNGNWLV